MIPLCIRVKQVSMQERIVCGWQFLSGSSMAGLPLAGLPRGTHGDGADRADSGIASDSDDGGAASSTFALSSASGMPGLYDLDDCEEHEDFVLRPRWDGDTACSDGCWKIQTRGGGDAEKDDRDSVPGLPHELRKQIFRFLNVED